MRISRQGQAYIYAICAVLFWSTIATAFKLTLRPRGPFDSWQLLFSATVSSTVCLFVILLIQGKWSLVVQCSRGEYIYSAFLGLLQPSLYYAILLVAYSRLPAQQAQPLNMTWPIAVVLLSIPLLKQPIQKKDFVALAICFLGVLVICLGGVQAKPPREEAFQARFTDPLGVSLAVGSSVIWALFWIYNVRDQRDPVVKLFLGFTFAIIPTTLFALCFSSFRMNVVGLLGGAYVGVFEMGLTYFVWLKALTLSRTTAQVSILVYLMPFLSLLVIHFVLKEHVLPVTVLGLILIVAGILVQQYAGGRNVEMRTE